MDASGTHEWKSLCDYMFTECKNRQSHVWCGGEEWPLSLGGAVRAGLEGSFWKLLPNAGADVHFETPRSCLLMTGAAFCVCHTIQLKFSSLEDLIRPTQNLLRDRNVTLDMFYKVDANFKENCARHCANSFWQITLCKCPYCSVKWVLWSHFPDEENETENGVSLSTHLLSGRLLWPDTDGLEKVRPAALWGGQLHMGSPG